jgi:hypothetical protein
MMKVGLRCATLAIAVAATMSVTAQAAQLWYDGFSLADSGGDYTLTSFVDAPDPDPDYEANPLAGQSGGSGTFMTGGPWVQGGGDSAWVLPDTLERTFENGTPAQILPSVGGKVGDNPASRTGCCLTQRNGMAMATPWGGFTDPDGTTYISFLANFGEGPTLHHRVIEWWDGSVGDGSKTLEFGISEFSGIGDGGKQLALKVKDAVSGNFAPEVLLTNHTTWDEIQGITQFALLKFDMSPSGQDTISLYLNPVGDEASNTPDAQVTVDQYLMTHLGSFSAFVFGGAVEPSFDELRVGDAWADVQNNTAPHYWNVQVPEPTSLSLFGLALLGLGCGTRRRS